MKIKFTKEHTINKKYVKNDEENVNRELAETLIKSGVAVEVTKTKQKPKGD